MGRRINEKFMNVYIELDNLCSDKFSMQVGGVTEYINKLNNIRYAQGREEALPKLVRYRTIRNMISHEAGAMKRENGVSKADIKWIRKFTRKIKKKKDPISLYLRKAHRYLKFRKLRKIFFAAVIILLVLVILYLLYKLF